MNLFKNRAFHVQAVDPLDTKTLTYHAPKPPVDLVKLSATAISTATEVAKVGGALYVLKKVVDAGAEIAVLTAKARLK